MKVLLANPRGFCAGVDRAIAIVEQALAKFGAPIYVRHEVVHNRFVVDDLKAKGAVFVEGLDEVPSGSTVIFSAHGVSRAVRAEAAQRGLTVFDATCPLVTKVHSEVAKMHDQGREIVMIGHAGHPEVEGTMGQCTGGIHLVESVADVERLPIAATVPLAYVTQTTLSVDDAAAIVEALKRRYPLIVGPKRDDICYATQNRQDAGADRGCRHRRRKPQQLQFEPPARGRGAPRRAGVHDRPRRRAAARVDRRQGTGGSDGRSVRARGAGARGARTARRARRERGSRARRHGGAHRLSDAEGPPHARHGENARSRSPVRLTPGLLLYATGAKS
jgi:(E)-4-hydroxy-3-methyl-but-2-enyl pyrophosphate reductase